LSLQRLIERFSPHRVISLGDSFHDDRQVKLLDNNEKALLEGMMKGREWLWIIGNHDPEKDKAIAGEIATSLKIHGITLTHHPLETLPASHDAGSLAVIAGHLHPAASLNRSGRRRMKFVASANVSDPNGASGAASPKPQFPSSALSSRTIRPSRTAQSPHAACDGRANGRR
jgi:metallophosphoesterase superfamily enzyme